MKHIFTNRLLQINVYRYNEYTHTCSELKIVKSHANTSVFSSTANSPMTQVTPSRGRSMIVAFNVDLEKQLMLAKLLWKWVA